MQVCWPYFSLCLCSLYLYSVAAALGHLHALTLSLLFCRLSSCSVSLLPSSLDDSLTALLSQPGTLNSIQIIIFCCGCCAGSAEHTTPHHTHHTVDRPRPSAPCALRSKSYNLGLGARPWPLVLWDGRPTTEERTVTVRHFTWSEVRLVTIYIS